MFSFLNRGSNLNCEYPSVRETLPKSTLGYNTNNKYPAFPPLMADGRALISSYQSNEVINNNILKNSGITSNWKYRQYLTQNAKEIIHYNFTEACTDAGYYSRIVEPTPVAVHKPYNPPYLYANYMDNNHVIGIENTDLKQSYLSREQLNSRKIAPTITQEQLLMYESKAVKQNK
jgi:hypothetical protein